MSPASLAAQLKKGTLEFCLMALIGQRPRYGFELVKLLSEIGVVASEGTVYPILSRLRHNQLVLTEWQESAEGPPRRYYRLSPAGHAAVADFEKTWTDFRSAVDRILAKGDPQ